MWMGLTVAVLAAAAAAAGTPLAVPNPGFEEVAAGGTMPAGWSGGPIGGARGTAALDDGVARSGGRSLRLANASPLQAFVAVSVASSPITVRSETTYVARFWARGRAAKGCFCAVGFGERGDRRRLLPDGDFEWRQFTSRFTTPPGCTRVTIGFAADDVTRGLWIDDVSLERSPVQLANLSAVREPLPAGGVWPRPARPLARTLVVLDCSSASPQVCGAAAALQGMVNRRQPRIYLLNPTNPPGQDAVWLRWLQGKGYTGAEERVASLEALVARFRSEVRGVVVTDPALPGSVNAAFMLAGLRAALPAPPGLAERLRLPVVEDLRGRWKRNVDAYRYVTGRYWPRMSHRVLSWSYPLAPYRGARDYMVAFNVPTFWVSSERDAEPGADPDAEESYLEELLARTPPNVPVMGWPANGDFRGVQEYTGVRLLSEFGKFVPGTEFCSNLTVHAAVRPPATALRQRPLAAAGRPTLDPSRLYLSISIMDSGDALWYWQLHQRTIWDDPERGTVPMGWCMNATLGQMMAAVAQWYVERATPNDRFFAAVSGLGYMNAQVYGSRFRPSDRERAWKEYVDLTARACRELGLKGLSVYDGSWGERTPPPEVLERFEKGIDGLDYILADLGRHDSVRPDEAARMIGRTAVFHTLTRYQVWSTTAEVATARMERANAWLSGEIAANAPKARPGFMSAMAISWYYRPSWVRDLVRRLAPDVTPVLPDDLARLYREARAAGRPPRRGQRPAL
ncbi:MAG: hypothetical protein IT208_05410 [Chthonomonadales bacterium]|nr:hypothetical protein [Chthonomonadales bacterium]